MKQTTNPTAGQTTDRPLAPSGSYCSPDTPLRFIAGFLVVVLVVPLALLLMACGPSRVEACAYIPLSAKAVCR